MKRERKSVAAILGAAGGRAVAKKRGKAYMKRIGKAGAKKRWGKEQPR